MFSDFGLDVEVRVSLLPHGDPTLLPKYQTGGAAGADIHAALDHGEVVAIPPFCRHIIPTGITVEIPVGYHMEIRSRSGLAANKGVFVLNAPGTIDCDFRGEIKIILFNSGAEPFSVSRGDRIAQMVLMPNFQASWLVSKALGETARGAGGFGSTGV